MLPTASISDYFYKKLSLPDSSVVVSRVARIHGHVDPLVANLLTVTLRDGIACWLLIGQVYNGHVGGVRRAWLHLHTNDLQWKAAHNLIRRRYTEMATTITMVWPGQTAGTSDGEFSSTREALCYSQGLSQTEQRLTQVWAEGQQWHGCHSFDQRLAELQAVGPQIPTNCSLTTGQQASSWPGWVDVRRSVLVVEPLPACLVVYSWTAASRWE